MFKDANPGAPMLRADAFRFLTQNLGQAFDLALETKDPAYPADPPVLHADPQARRRRRRLHLPPGLDRREHAYGSPEGAAPRGGSTSPCRAHVRRRFPGTDWPSLHEPFGDIPEANIFGHQITDRRRRAISSSTSAARSAPKTGCRPRRVAASCSSARLSTPGSRRRRRCPSSASAWTAPRPIPTSGADDRGDGLGRRIPHRRDARLARALLETTRAASAIQPSSTSSRPTSPPTPTPTPSAGGWPRTWSGSCSPTRR